MALLGKPQVQPTIPTAPVVKNWTAMQSALTGLYKLLQGLVLYLQTYLTNVYNAVVPSQLNPVTVLNTESPYTVAATDEFLIVSGGAAGTTIALPVATGSGRTLIAIKADSGAGAVTLAANGTDTINGVATIVLTTQFQTARLIDAATGVWYIW